MDANQPNTIYSVYTSQGDTQIFIFTLCWMSGFMKQYKRIVLDRFISVVIMRMILFVLLSMNKMHNVSTKP